MQVALATDCVGTPGKDEDAITLRNVIAAQEVAATTVATVVEGLSIKRGSLGALPHQGKRVREPENSVATRLTMQNVDGYHSKLDSE